MTLRKDHSWLREGIENLALGTKHEAYLITTLQKLHLRKMGFGKSAIAKILADEKAPEKMDIKSQLSQLNERELERIFDKVLNKMRDLKKPPHQVYVSFQQQCEFIIHAAILRHDDYCCINFNELLAPYNCYTPSKIDDIYNKLEDFFWNAFEISIDFGGNNNGSGVDIFYKKEPKPEIEEKVNSFLPSVIEQLTLMEFNESEELNVDGICMIGKMFPPFYRSLNAKLEQMKIGKIVSYNSKKCVLKA